MQDEMVAELKAAGTSVQGSSGNTASSSVETALTDTFMHESRVTLEGLDDLGSTPKACLLYTSPSPRDATRSRMPSSD